MMLESIYDYYEHTSRSALIYGCGAAFLAYYLTNVVKRPKLICGNASFKKFLQRQCPLIQQNYWPTLWCFESRFMTMLASVLRQGSFNTHYTREIIATPDGGQIALDWYEPENSNLANAPVALFLPGLTGHSQSAYVRVLVCEAYQAGYRPAVLINRGISGLELLNSKIYCGADTSDLRLALDHIKKQKSDVKIVAAGISLGGIILARYLVESGSQSLISAAMVISACFDLLEGAKSLEEPWFNLALNKSLTTMCVELVKEHENTLSKRKNVNFDSVKSSKTLRQFDDHFTSKMFNFGSAANYYSEASLRGRLHAVKVPLLLLNAADDIFAPSHTLPYHEVQAASSHVAMVITNRGGHIAFMDGIIPTGRYYFERLYSEYVLGLLPILQNNAKVFE